jgi:hypothetical protein
MIPLPLRPQAQIEWHLLALLSSREKLETSAAYRALAERLQLTSAELAVIVRAEKPEPAWKYECRQAVRRLKDDGYVISVRRGLWAITTNGREAVSHRGIEYNSTAHTAEELGL